MKLLPVVMSGGSGTRLWPVSRSHFPKQFCELLDKPLHTLTLERLKKYGPAIIVTSEKFRDLTESDIRKNAFAVEKVLYEPQARNTAAAIALLCRYLEMSNRTGEIVGVFSSDNLILNPQSFYDALAVAVTDAESGFVSTLGIKPHRPETGFGYIEVQHRAIGTMMSTKVLRFHEKPTLDRASEFIQSGNYFWNAGIFLFKVSVMIELFKRHEPKMWESLQALTSDLQNLAEVYAALKNISIDYAVLEKLSGDELRCVTCDIGWSDLGSWDSITEVREQYLNTKNENLLEVAARGNSLFSDKIKNYSLLGVDDLIVVDTEDALLICKKGQSQKVKDVVDRVSVKNKRLVEDHVFENRPWGKFEVLEEREYFKSKIIKVDPRQKISYQSHAHRAEHWIIVKGSATVVLNDVEKIVQTGEHIFIPQGAKHRIVNNGNTVVEFIEVQVGSYFGEDDIVRYQDDYGRKK